MSVWCAGRRPVCLQVFFESLACFDQSVSNRFNYKIFLVINYLDPNRSLKFKGSHNGIKEFLIGIDLLSITKDASVKYFLYIQNLVSRFFVTIQKNRMEVVVVFFGVGVYLSTEEEDEKALVDASTQLTYIHKILF